MKQGLAYLNKVTAFLERYKYPALVLLIGLVLVLWPSGKREEQPARDAALSVTEPVARDEGRDYREELERELSDALSQVEGAGRVRVLLTLKTGPSSRYQTDLSRASSREGDRGSESWEEKTVMLDRGSAYNEPAVVSTAYPVFQGALILAEGAGNAEIRLRLSAAVTALLGLGADQITVVKMK